MKPLKRFVDRIGKAIKKTTSNWQVVIQIQNKHQAEYLYECHISMWIQYIDTKEEVTNCDQLKDLFWFK
jgi:hypothetical protein